MSLIRSHSQWPGGGYPSFIHRHKEPLAWEDFHAATRAWRCFVREQWMGGATANQQKRDLIERWATAEQEFRDSYQSRAPEDEPSFYEGPELHDESFTRTEASCCMVYICITEWTPEKQALLAKCILALFPWDSGWPFLADEMIMFVPFPDCSTQDNILDTFKFHQSVSRPNFLDMHMAIDGTVLFQRGSGTLIIDDRTLETGLGLWAEFNANGNYSKAYRCQMMVEDFDGIFLDIGPGMRRSLCVALNHIESRNVYRDRDEDPDSLFIFEDAPVDMRRPIVEIYASEFELLDEYAPGFRESEKRGNGLAIGYDLRRIHANEEGQGPLIITDYPTIDM